MDSIDNLKTDANIANILQKLKNTKAPDKPVPKDINKEQNRQSLMIPVSDIPVAVQTSHRKQEPEENSADVLKQKLKDNSFVDSLILPWLDERDKDTRLLHYAVFNDSGNANDDSGYLTNTAIKTDNPAKDLASIKLKQNYACDIDYYKSKHFVLCVKQFESSYPYGRSYSKLQENMNDKLSTPEIVNVPTEDIALQISSNDKYNHFVVFTDLGVADFLARQDDLPYPFGEDSLSKWFEETSNFVPLKLPNYQPNPMVVSDDVNSIREFKYNIVTMHQPGVITLDAVDNDSNYQLHLKLKDEYNFIPIGKVLKCIKHYATLNTKSFSDFKRFINKYFDIVVTE